MNRYTFVAAAAAMIVASPALAALVTAFGDEASFLAAVTNPTLEDFNDEALVPQMDGGVILATDFTVSSVMARIGIEPGSALSQLDGTQYFAGFVNTDAGEDTITLTFTQPITAFGATFDAPSSTAGIALETAQGRALSSFDFVTGFNDSFLGFTSTTPFTSVDIVRSGDNVSFGEIFGMDNVYYVAVPEANAVLIWGLLSTAAAGTAWRRRIRCA